LGVFAAVAFAASSLFAADAPKMKAVIGGEAGLLGSAEVSEVWAKGEVVIRFLKPRDGAERVLLKGADTTLVADGYRFYSDRVWTVTRKQTYKTVGGVERSILVAEPADPSQPGHDGCRFSLGKPQAHCGRGYSHIVQILGDKEMLVTMKVSPGVKVAQIDGGGATIGGLLLRGVDTTKLTEDSRPPFGRYPITGTYRYESTGGTTQTVFVADAEKAEADRLAAQKRLEEEQRNKAEAERKAKAEREAAEKAEKERKAQIEKAKWRTWSDKAGTFKIEAKILGLAGDDVVLKKRDGKIVRLALEELSADDQEWVEQWKKLHSKPR
jgi:hypothetical protein